MAEKPILLIFFLNVVGLFFLFLTIYYYISPFLLLFTAKLVNFVLTGWFEKFIASVSLLNREIEVITWFSIAGSKMSQLAFDINPLKYSYGLPLFFALIFSYGGEPIDKLLKCILAYLVISCAQVWGISFDIIRHLLFEFSSAYAAHFNFSSLQILLISYGSQLGFLLLPSLTPILLWIYLENKKFNSLINK
ncbi:MAG: exosortase H-associated membrane protein [Pseudomonadota bacterium]